MSATEAGAEDATVLVEDRPARGRRCIAQRVRADRATMLRFVVGPDDRLVFDVDARLPGRGLWLSADRQAVKKAIARNLFAKAARQRVEVDPDLAERLIDQIRARCLQWLGLAQRAAAIEVGFEQVERAAREGSLAVLLVARDAGADGLGKLARFGLPVLRDFTSREIGAALGRPTLVYAGLRPGRLADKLRADAAKLLGLGGGEVASAGADGEVASADADGGDDHGTGAGPGQRG